MKRRKRFIHFILILSVFLLIVLMLFFLNIKFTGEVTSENVEYLWKFVGEDGFPEESCELGVNDFQCDSDNIGKVGWTDEKLDRGDGYYTNTYSMSNVKCVPWDKQGYYIGDELMRLYKYECVIVVNSSKEEASKISDTTEETKEIKEYYSDNLLKNGDFQSDSIGKNIPDSWRKNSWNDAGVVYGIEWTSFGKGATIEVKDKKNSWVGIRSEIISLEPNTKYNLNSMLYCGECSNPENFVLTFHVGKKGATGVSHYILDSSERISKYSKGYDKMNYTFTTNDEKDLFAYVIVAFKPGTVGKGYVDEVELRKISSEKTETEASENITNDSQETGVEMPLQNETSLGVFHGIKKILINTFESLQANMYDVQKIAGTEENFYENDLGSYKHPVVLYKDIDVIKNRISREPYSVWWKEIVNYADDVIGAGVDISELKRIDRAKYAKATAFVYAVTGDKRYGDVARDLLVSMDEGTYDINHHEPIDGLVWFSEAYDILRGANYDFGNLDECRYSYNCRRVWTWRNFGGTKCDVSNNCNLDIRRKIYAQAKSLAKSELGDVIDKPDNFLTTNNLHIRRYSAVGIAGLALNNKELFDIALNKGVIVDVFGTEVDFYDDDSLGEVINKQIVHNMEGGWAEGPYYMRYAFNVLLPFMKGMKNAGFEHDWLNVNRLRSLFDWGIKIRMPNGARPPFDDSNIDATYFFSGYLDEPVYNWDWNNAEHKYYSNAPPVVYKIDALSYYDDEIEEEKPSWNPTQVLPGAGQLVFRSGWDKKDIYLMMLAENGKALDKKFFGNTHEHVDTLSFIVYAYGKYLAIDSGYIDYSHREKVSQPENHNVILIDNALSSEALISKDNFFSTDYLDYGEASNSAHERGILFVDKKYFLIFDILDSYKYHNYKFLLHGNGLDGTETFKAYSSGKVEWIQDGVGLLSYVVPKEGDEIKLGKDIHSDSYQNTESHTYLSVLRRGKNEGFLTLLYPSDKRDYPKTQIEVTGSIHILTLQGDGWEAKAFVNEANKPVKLTDFNITTDASKFFIKIRDDGEIDYIFVDDCKYFFLEGKELFNLNSPATFLINFDGETLEVYHNSDEKINLVL